MKNNKMQLALFICIIFIGSFAFYNCSQKVNPDDPDMENSKYSIEYYSMMRVDDYNNFHFNENDKIENWETAANQIRFYQVFYTNSGTLYKVKEFFEKVGGDYPRLYAYYVPEYNDKNQIITLDTYRRYGDGELLFVLASKVKNHYNDRDQLIKKEYFEYWPLLNDEWRANIKENEQGEQLLDSTEPAQIVYFENGLMKKRIYNDENDVLVKMYYSYDGEGNRTRLLVLDDEEKKDYELAYNEDGFGTDFSDYRAAVQWESDEVQSIE